MKLKNLKYNSANKNDFEDLVRLRIKAMKPSLEKVGRFTPERARERFKKSFIPENTTIIKNQNELIGFYMITENDESLFLNHLYIDPKFQGKGYGTEIINKIKNASNKLQKDILLEALKESPANNFYLKNGFEYISSSEFDNNYICRNNKKIYVSDLDSTLLNSQAELSDFTIKGIRSLIEKNIYFTVASARSVKSIQKIFYGIDLQLPIIEFNGAFISGLKTGEHLRINSINSSLYKELLNGFIEKNYNCIISTFNGTEDKLYYEKTTNDGDIWYIKSRIDNRDTRLEKVKSIESIKGEDIICITIIDKYENLKNDYEKLKDNSEIEVHLQENIYSPGWYWLTIHDHKATKDQAILELLKMKNMNDYKVIAFGDNSNDIKMLNAAHTGVVVNNANDEIKKIADEIIESNDEDGVIKYILREEGHI